MLMVILSISCVPSVFVVSLIELVLLLAAESNWNILTANIFADGQQLSQGETVHP